MGQTLLFPVLSLLLLGPAPNRSSSCGGSNGHKNKKFLEVAYSTCGVACPLYEVADRRCCNFDKLYLVVAKLPAGVIKLANIVVNLVSSSLVKAVFSRTKVASPRIKIGFSCCGVAYHLPLLRSCLVARRTLKLLITIVKLHQRTPKLSFGVVKLLVNLPYSSLSKLLRCASELPRSVVKLPFDVVKLLVNLPSSLLSSCFVANHSSLRVL